MRHKLLIIGFENTKSDDKRDAMEPYTPNGAGERLYHMVNAVKKISKAEYCKRLEFINVAGAGGVGLEAARQLMKDRNSVVVGLDAWNALKMYRVTAFWDARDGAYLVPHTSGKNYLYNLEEACRKTGHLIWRLM
jgi:hypothetical protein